MDKSRNITEELRSISRELTERSEVEQHRLTRAQLESLGELVMIATDQSEDIDNGIEDRPWILDAVANEMLEQSVQPEWPDVSGSSRGTTSSSPG